MIVSSCCRGRVANRPGLPCVPMSWSLVYVTVSELIAPVGGVQFDQTLGRSSMFRIRFFTPAVINEEGWQHAGGELVVGDARMCFLVDLTHWTTGHYARQWQAGIQRLAQGAPSTALMTGYRGRGDRAHTMWALWRDDAHVYVQEHSVLPADVEGEFDPDDAYAHVGVRIPSIENALPIPEWRVKLEDVQAALLGIRLPKFPR